MTATLNKHLVRKRSLLLFGLLLLGLSFVSGSLFRSSPAANLEEKLLERYLHRQEADFNVFIKDTPLLRRLVQQSEQLISFNKISQKKYGIYLYAETLFGQDLIFWNNNQVLPSDEMLAGPDGTNFQRLSNGYYVVRKQHLQLPGMSNRVLVYALIPVFQQHDIHSRYLLSRFVHDANAHKKISLSMTPSPHAIAGLSGETLFYINHKAFTPTPANDIITFLVRLAALLLLAVYLHMAADSVVRRKGAVKGVSLLVIGLLTLRGLLFYYPHFFQFRQYQLFGPEIYASNWLNPSLGDLLLNALTFCWIVIFAWYHTGAIKKMPSWLQGRRKYIAGIAALFVLILYTFGLADIVRSLVADSKVSFQVNDFSSWMALR